MASALLAACSDTSMSVPAGDAASLESGSDARTADDTQLSAEAEAGMDGGPDISVSSDADPGGDAALETSIPGDAPTGPPAPTEVLAAQSPSCLDCAAAYCGTYIEGCSTLGGRAAKGPAAGELKSELCEETLACVLSTHCVACLDPSTGCSPVAKLGDCYCRWQDPIVKAAGAFCQPPQPPFAGPCKSIFEKSLETTDPFAILAASSDFTSGGGWALQIMQCLVDNRCDSCFPSPGADMDGGNGD
jgi:hypothetical protein